VTVYAYTEDDEEVVVREVDSEWFAFCSCAWRSEPMATRGAAEDAAEDHAIMHSIPREVE
jgi:hypothetical protein